MNNFIERRGRFCDPGDLEIMEKVIEFSLNAIVRILKGIKYFFSEVSMTLSNLQALSSFSSTIAK